MAHAHQGAASPEPVLHHPNTYTGHWHVLLAEQDKSARLEKGKRRKSSNRTAVIAVESGGDGAGVGVAISSSRSEVLHVLPATSSSTNAIYENLLI